jgi:hypothetical protein
VHAADPDEFDEPMAPPPLDDEPPPLLDDEPPPPPMDEPIEDIPSIDDLGGDTEAERLERKRRDEAERMERIREEQMFVEDETGRQRRQNVRVDVQLPITIRMSGREAPGRPRDVSATGIGFSTRLPVELDQRGEVTVEFDGWRFTKAYIIRFVKPILAGYQVGVQFDELTQEEREKLVKQVFDVQRAQLQGIRGRGR